MDGKEWTALTVTINQAYIHVAGVKLYCEYELNDRPSILLIHGFASSSYTFRKIVPLLRVEFSIISVDLPGFGRSEKSTSFIYSFENYANMLLELLDHFKIEKTNIVAHSMGGQIALHMAKKSPERVDKLVLLCSSGYLRRAKKTLIYSSYLPFFDRVAYFYVHRKNVTDYLQNVFFNTNLISDEMIKEFSRPLSDRGFYKSLIRLVRHREGDLEPNELKQIKIPTLLIWGENDRVVPVHVGKRLVQDLPNAKLITYKKTGHLITEERPESIVQQIWMHFV